MNKLFDLRFVIGLFFFVIGILLLLYYFIAAKGIDQRSDVNLWSGLAFVLFGILMLLMSRNKVDNNDAAE